MRLHKAKEAEAAERLLRNAEGRLSVSELDNLLRLSDQAALARWGRPVCFGFGSPESAGRLEGKGAGPNSYREMMEAEGMAREDIEAL